MAFDSHSLIDHEHNDHEHDGEKESYFEDKKVVSKSDSDHSHNHDHENNQLNNDKKNNGRHVNFDFEKDDEHSINKNHVPFSNIRDNFSDDARHRYHNHEDKLDNGREKECITDEEEQAIKNVVSSKGKYASFLHVRNIMQGSGDIKVDKALMTATKIMSMSKHVSSDEEDILSHNLGVSPKELCQKLNDDNDPAITNHHHFNPKSSLTPYILLVALSFHGFFEGTALGIQSDSKTTIYLLIAILSHKWAESFTLGISFAKAKTEYHTFVKLILLFSIFTPLGIIVGIFLSGSSLLIEGIFLALSTGIFF